MYKWYDQRLLIPGVDSYLSPYSSEYLTPQPTHRSRLFRDISMRFRATNDLLQYSETVDGSSLRKFSNITHLTWLYIFENMMGIFLSIISHEHYFQVVKAKFEMKTTLQSGRKAFLGVISIDIIWREMWWNLSWNREFKKEFGGERLYMTAWSIFQPNFYRKRWRKVFFNLSCFCLCNINSCHPLHSYRDHEKSGWLMAKVAFTIKIVMIVLINKIEHFGHWKDTHLWLKSVVDTFLILFQLQMWTYSHKAHRCWHLYGWSGALKPLLGFCYYRGYSLDTGVIWYL